MQPAGPSLVLLLLLLLLGMVRAGPAVVSEDVKGRLVFRGTVLEGINGSSLDKRLEEDARFCDVDFILMMLQQVAYLLLKV
jgi:hypothetical protein